MKTEEEYKKDMWAVGTLFQQLINKLNYRTEDVFTISEKHGITVYNLWIFNDENILKLKAQKAGVKQNGTKTKRR